MNKNQWLTLATLFKNVVIRKKKYVVKLYAKSEEGLWKRWYYDWNKNHKCTWDLKKETLGCLLVQISYAKNTLKEKMKLLCTLLYLVMR